MNGGRPASLRRSVVDAEVQVFQPAEYARLWLILAWTIANQVKRYAINTRMRRFKQYRCSATPDLARTIDTAEDGREVQAWY